jgi:hypothetical protein
MQAAIGQPGGGGSALLFLTFSAIEDPRQVTETIAEIVAHVKL